MKVRKVILHLIFCFIGMAANAQLIKPETSIDFREIQAEIEWFINKVKVGSYESGNYNVYLIKILLENGDDYCTSMGYIQDSLWVSEIKDYKYYMELKGEIILIQLPDRMSVKRDDRIKLLQDSKLIANRIYPGTVFLSTPPGYVCCFTNENIVKVYYNDADEMPYDKKIFKYIPLGETIKVDSSTMKQMFRNKKRN